MTGCRNDVPTKARILTSFSVFPPRLSFVSAVLSTIYDRNAFFAYLHFVVILTRYLQMIEIQTYDMYYVSSRSDILKACRCQKFELSIITGDSDWLPAFLSTRMTRYLFVRGNKNIAIKISLAVSFRCTSYFANTCSSAFCCISTLLFLFKDANKIECGFLRLSFPWFLFSRETILIIA